MPEVKDIPERIAWDALEGFKPEDEEKSKFFKINHYLLKLVLFSGLFLFILKLSFSSNYPAIFLNSLLEFFILFGLYGLMFFGSKLIPKKKVLLRGSAKFVFYLVFFFNFFVFAGHSIFLDESLLMKYSFSSLDWSMLSFFLQDIMPLKYVVLLPLVFIVLGIAARLDLSKLEPIEKHFKIVFLVLFVFSIVMLALNYDNFSNVYANTIYEGFTYDYIEEVRLNESFILAASYPEEMFDKGIKNYSNYFDFGEKKVLVFVMEQTSYKTFLEDIQKIPVEKNFFERVKENSHVYTNYYAGNQDSRAAVWTFLTSRYIPFESYIGDWAEKYGFILGENNLVEFFNNNGYNTQVVASIYTPSLLLSAHNWGSVTFLKQGDGKEEKYLCLHEFEFQHGCEDMAILDDVRRIIRKNRESGLFMLQEFIYGHGTTFEETLGKSRTEYYNDYLFELYGFLEEEDLLEDTIIVVVADHGEKGYFEKELWNYQLPLIIVNKDLSYKEVNGLYSYSDLKDILLSYIEGSNLEEVEYGRYIIGQTKSSDVGYIDKEGRYFLSKLYGDDLVKIRTMNGMNKSEVAEKMAVLMKYRLDSINKSTSKNFWCNYCEANAVKAGLVEK